MILKMELHRLLVIFIQVIGLLEAKDPYAAGIICSLVNIPNLTDVFPSARSARVCHPNATDGKLFPLHVWAHGDFGGGPFAQAYNELQEQVASSGFVVAVFHSCAYSPFECDGGRASFLEILKTLQYFESPTNEAPVDLSKPYSVSGHSTGARAVLMLASLRDTPAYLAGTKYASEVTKEMRASLSRVAVVISDHPDPMYESRQNPDVPNFAVSKTPVVIMTGSKDTTEPKLSGWKDFLMIAPPAKVFVNIAGASHLQPIENHAEGPFIAYASQFFALGNSTAGQLIYGTGPGTLQHLAALGGSYNCGANVVCFLACGRNHMGSFAVPANYSEFCNASHTDRKSVV